MDIDNSWQIPKLVGIDGYQHQNLLIVIDTYLHKKCYYNQFIDR